MRRHHNTVPTTREVIPGAPVNIVLKADQPTGRTVSGTVRDVLTRGNHPRGIKVRLADGRVGRVHSIASSAAEADRPGEGAGETASSEQPASGGPTGGNDYDGPVPGPRRGARGRRTMHGGAEEGQEGEDVPSLQVGLDAYIKPARGKGKRKGNAPREGVGNGGARVEQAGSGEATGSSAPGQQELGLVRCPVCADFEGDEAAVAHHVAGHFDD